MNTQTFKGHWNELKGKIKEKWGKLTDDDMTEISGKRDQLVGKLQKKYGYEKDKAEKELKTFEDSLTNKEVDTDRDDMEDEEI